MKPNYYFLASVVSLMFYPAESKDRLESAQLPSIETPNDLTARMKTEKLIIPQDWKNKKIKVSVSTDEPEITLLNSEVSRTLSQ